MDNTVFDVFARQARASPRAFFLQDAFEDAVGLRYGEAFDLVVRIAGVLEPMMQRQRRRVALVSTSNSPLIPLLSLASWSIGASVGLAAVNDATPLDVLSAQLACLEPCLIITDESVGRSNSFSSKLTEAFDQAFPEAPGLQRPLRSTLAGLVFGAHSREPASLKSLSLFASSGQSSSSISPRRREQGLVEEEEAYRLFTSSAISWSTVKAVKIPHRSLMTNVVSLRSTFPRMAASRHTLGILPLSHTIGFVLDFIVATVTTGGTYLLLDRHAAQRQSDSIANVASDAVAEQSRRATPVDTMWAVPALFDEMAARARQEPVLLHALQQARFISVAGAYPSRDTLQWAAKNKIRLGTSWGMSEVFLSSFGARLAFDDDDDRVASTDLLDALVLLPTVDFQLVPVDDGAPEGWCELVFGRRDIFTGYVVLDDDWRPVFKPVEETFRTGDVFEIVGRRRAHQNRTDIATDDVLTLVRYVGRNDDVVQLAVGEKVLCSAVEQQLSMQDGIKAAFVTGNRSKKEGRPSETLVALVECSGDVDFKRVVAKALAKVNPQLSPAARIGARTLAQVDSLPMTSKGSLFRKKVAAHLVEPLAGLSAAWIARQVRQHLAEIADLDGIGLEDDHEMAALALTSQQSVKVVSFIRQLTGDGSMEPVDVQAQGTVSAFEDVVKSRYVAVAFSQSPAPTGQTVSRQEADQPTRDPRPEPSGTTKISIAGAALRLPGGVDDLEDLWHASVSARGKDGRAILETASQDGRCDAEEAMRHGWLDRRGITDFDPETFGISTSEAVFVKPQQRLVLELALEALQDAGLPPSTLLGKRVGVFVAANGQDGYDKLLLDEADNGVHTLGAHYGHGTHNASLAGRVAHWLGSCGPAMTIETACSGGLTAVHAAQRSLKAGDCDVALVAGVTTFIDPERQFPFRRQAGMATQSPQQQSRAFSSSADGMVPSEGAVAVVLQAQHGANTGARHGEPLAWIESIECEHQGASATMMTTRSDAQSRLIHHALAAAKVEPQAIDVFECHGSATQLGDLVEFGAIRRVFGGSEAKRAAPVAITASKNIFGHTEEAAGLVGLLHAIVSLRHRSSPPSHVSDPNIDFDWAGAGARYSNCRTSLGRGQSSHMHALVSSYGFSGTMCSAVLRAGQQHPPPRQEQDERLANLLFLSAPDRTRLRLVGKACVEHLRNAPHDLEALQAAVHHRGRESFPIRQAIDLGIPRDQSGLANSLGMLLEGEAEGESEMHHAEKATSSLHRSHRPRLVVQFAGMGRIARGAARSFYDNNSVYRKTFEEVSMRFSQHDPSMDLVQAVYGTASHGENEPNALETSTATAQPALFAVYYSLWKATTSLLRQPVDIVFGHSFGEIAAACASGILSLEDAVELVYVRSRCCEATSRHCPGAMLAVRCAKADLVQSGILQPASEIVIAAENAEEAYTISLPAAELESVEARLHAAAIPFRRLKTQSVAFHHPMLHHDSAFSLAAVDEKLARLAVDRAKEAPSAFKPKDSTDKPSFVSCSRPTAPDTLPSWHQHLCQPVHYAQTAEAVLFAQTSPPLGRHREETKAAVVLEIGLGAELSSLTRRRALHSNATNVAVPVEAVSLFGSQGDDCFVETLKRLFELGIDVQLPVSLATRRQPMLALNRRRFWPKGRLPKVGHGQDRPQPQHTVALEKRRGTAAPSSSWSRHQGAEQVQTGRGWAEHHLVCNEEQRDPFSIAAWLSSLLARRSGERTCYIFQDKQPLSSSGNADVVLTARASPGQAGFTVSVTPLEQQSHDGGGAFKHLEATPLANLDELPAWINAYEASSTSAEPSSVHLLDVPNAGNDVVYLLQTSSTAFEALLSCSTMSSTWTCLVNVFASLGLDTAMTPLLLDVAALQEGAAEESDALRVSIVKRDDVWRAVVRTVDGDLVCALQSAASNFAPSADGKSSSTHGSPALTSSSFAPSSPFLQGSGSSCCSSVCSLSSSITSHFSGQTTSHLAKLPGADVSNASSDALGTLVGAALRLEPERIESKRQLGDYGLDSFRATHLSEMLDARFGVDVSHVSLLQDMTLGRLRDLVSSR